MLMPNIQQGGGRHLCALVRLLAAVVGAELFVGIFREIAMVADSDRSGFLDPRRWSKDDDMSEAGAMEGAAGACGLLSVSARKQAGGEDPGC